MDKKIEQILNDLYMIDKNFKKYEKEVRKIVEELVRSKPNVVINEKFIADLHSELLTGIESKKEKEGNRVKFTGNFWPAKKLSFAFMGTALVLFAVIGTSYYFNRIKNPSGIIAIDFAPKIESLKEGAFGSLAFDQSKTTSVPGIGGGGGSALQSGEKSGIIGMPSPDIINYRYIYKGGDIAIQDKATVYKRIKNSILSGNAANALSSFNLGLIDLNKFSNTRVNNISFSEDRSFGYDINIDFREGMISIYAGTQWPEINPINSTVFKNGINYSENQLKESDMPKDEELISIADNFLKNYQIDKSPYGEPMVQKNYIEYYKGPAANGAAVYIPETIPVVYPLKINNQIVYDDANNPTGLTIDVSIRHKKAYGARNIYAQKYESSNYESEQDKNKIISFAEKGGMFGFYNVNVPEANKTINVELGTPEVKLISTWNYNPDKRSSDIIYLPAYIFPILNPPQEQYYFPKNIIVPIPKEMLDRSNNPGIIDQGPLR